MFMPISRFLILAISAAMLTACGKNGDAALKEAEKEATEEAIANGKIECALAGAKDFQRVCTTERMSTENGQMLVIRHPNGGFRRFRVLTDGRGLTPADGFDPDFSIHSLGSNAAEIRSGNDRYHIPARTKAEAATPKAG